MPDISVSGCDGRQDDRCFFWVSPIGSANVTEPRSEWKYYKLKIGDTSMTYTIDRWYEEEAKCETVIAGGSIVGSGDYQDSYGTIAEPGPFHRADNGSFDSLAVGPDTTVAIYPQKNYYGTPLVVTGPKVLVNHILTSRGYWGDQWLTENWGTSDPILRWFPPATRELTAPGVTLHGFGRGSVKVECS